MIKRISDTEYTLGVNAKVLAPGKFWEAIGEGTHPVFVNDLPVKVVNEAGEFVIPADMTIAPVKNTTKKEEPSN